MVDQGTATTLIVTIGGLLTLWLTQRSDAAKAARERLTTRSMIEQTYAKTSQTYETASEVKDQVTNGGTNLAGEVKAIKRDVNTVKARLDQQDDAAASQAMVLAEIRHMMHSHRAAENDSAIDTLAQIVECAGHRVLFVDDEPDILNIYERVFARYYSVVVASSAAEALLEIARYENDGPIRAVFSDHMMPQTSGVEFLASIRKTHPALIRVLVTAHSDRETMLKAINESHAFLYIMKPVEWEAFRVAVKRAVALSLLIDATIAAEKKQSTEGKP